MTNPQNIIDYACPVERRRSTDFQTPWDAFVFYIKRGAWVLGLMALSFLMGVVTGLYLPNYTINKKITELQTEKQKLCTQLYGPEATVVDGLCAMKNGKVVRK